MFTDEFMTKAIKTSKFAICICISQFVSQNIFNDITQTAIQTLINLTVPRLIVQQFNVKISIRDILKQDK